MITIELRDKNRYEVFSSGESIGFVSTRRNPFHARTCYLNLELTWYEPPCAEELFKLLRAELHRPLQVMLYSWEREKCSFLVAGGFQRKRRCYEMEVGRKDLTVPIEGDLPKAETVRGETPYSDCCELLYESYAGTHEAVNPLTADRETFCRALPDKVLYAVEDGGIAHFAFADENEIAYVGTVRQSGFRSFACALLAEMFCRYDTVSFECDDCDPAAMELKSFFRTSNEDSYDTYILD